MILTMNRCMFIGNTKILIHTRMRTYTLMYIHIFALMFAVYVSSFERAVHTFRYPLTLFNRSKCIFLNPCC